MKSTRETSSEEATPQVSAAFAFGLILSLLGPTLIGIGLGLYFYQVWVGVLIGLGIGACIGAVLLLRPKVHSDQ